MPAHTTPDGRRPHFTDLDGIRGLLAFAVMLHHYGLNTIIDSVTGGAIGPARWSLCVDFFFLLSGFVIGHSIYNREPGVMAYFRRRLWRLVPVHLAALAIGMIFYAQRESFSMPVLAWNLALLNQFVGVAPLNHPSWSAGYELYLPLLLVAALPMLKRRSMAWTLGLALLALLASMTAAYLLAAGDRFDLLRAGGGLTLGFALNHARRLAGEIRTAVSPFVLPVLTGLLFAGLLLTGLSPLFALTLHLIAVPIILLGTASKSLLSSPPFWWLGAISYSLYLVHVPVLLWFQHVFGPTIEGAITLKLGLVATSLAIATLITFMIERPLMRMGARRAGAAPRRVAPAGSGH